MNKILFATWSLELILWGSVSQSPIHSGMLLELGFWVEERGLERGLDSVLECISTVKGVTPIAGEKAVNMSTTTH